MSIYYAIFNKCKTTTATNQKIITAMGELCDHQTTEGLSHSHYHCDQDLELGSKHLNNHKTLKHSLKTWHYNSLQENIKQTHEHTTPFANFCRPLLSSSAFSKAFFILSVMWEEGKSVVWWDGWLKLSCYLCTLSVYCGVMFLKHCMNKTKKEEGLEAFRICVQGIHNEA